MGLCTHLSAPNSLWGSLCSFQHILWWGLQMTGQNGNDDTQTPTHHSLGIYFICQQIQCILCSINQTDLNIPHCMCGCHPWEPGSQCARKQALLSLFLGITRLTAPRCQSGFPDLTFQTYFSAAIIFLYFSISWKWCIHFIYRISCFFSGVVKHNYMSGTWYVLLSCILCLSKKRICTLIKSHCNYRLHIHKNRISLVCTATVFTASILDLRVEAAPELSLACLLRASEMAQL